MDMTWFRSILAQQKLWGGPALAVCRTSSSSVDGVLLMTSPAVTQAVVEDCAQAGIRRVWMYSAGSQGAVSPKAVEFCRERGIQVVPGECPLMFFPHNGSTGFTGSFARLPGVIRIGSMDSLDESSTKSPAQAELGRGIQYPQEKKRYPREKIRMNPVAVRSGERNCASCPVPRARASAARYPLRTAPSMVAGHPVAVQSPGRKTRGQGVTGPGLYASMPGRGE